MNHKDGHKVIILTIDTILIKDLILICSRTNSDQG